MSKSLNELMKERENVLKIQNRHRDDLEEWKGLRETSHLRKAKRNKRRTIKKLQEIIDRIDDEIKSLFIEYNGESRDE